MDNFYLPKDLFWISLQHAFDLHEIYIRFRKSLVVKNISKKINLFITADSRYVLWINSTLICRGPSRSNPSNQIIDVIDITKYFTKGENIICVLVYQPGYSHFSYIHRATTGLLAYFILDNKFITTDKSWKASKDESFDSKVPRQSIYQSGVEKRDLRLDDKWLNNDYDSSNWEQARIVAEPFDYPWTNMSLRSLPLLKEKIADIELINVKENKSKVDGDTLNQHKWNNSNYLKNYKIYNGWYSVNNLNKNATYWLFDLNRGCSFQAIINFKNADGGELINIFYIEKLYKDQPYISDHNNYCKVRMYDQYTLGEGSQKIVPYNIRGGRFLILEIKNANKINFKIKVNISFYPLNKKKIQPIVKDKSLSNIRNICRNTFLGCLQDGFIDNPWRENAQWLGDALPQSYIMSSISNDFRPLKRIIDLAEEGIYPDNLLPSVVPSEAHSYSVLDFNFIWLELLDFYFFQTKDKDFIYGKTNIIKGLIENFKKYTDKDGLLISKPGKRLFLDWSLVSRNEPNAIYNFHYLYFLQKSQKIFNDIKYDYDLSKLIKTLKLNLIEKFFYNNIWYDDYGKSTFSQQSASFSILTEINEAKNVNSILSDITECSLNEGKKNKMILSSPFMHFYVLLALEKHDKFQDIIRIIKIKWGYWAKKKYPTTWENWNVDFPDGSQCHSFSAHPIYFINQYYEKLQLKKF